MKPVVFYCCLLLVVSCNGKVANTEGGPVTTARADSAILSDDAGKLVYIERADLMLTNYMVSVKTKFLLPDTLSEDSSYYLKGNYLIVSDKGGHGADTLLLAASYTSPSDLEIQEAPDSLRFKTLVLNIHWRGDSDMLTDVFIEYRNNKLNELFSVDELEALQRKDEWTLSGFITSRDELVESSEHDYPFTVSLKDHKVHIKKPAKQYIGYSTTALTAIKGYRLPAPNDTVAYTIKKGTTLTVDTLYRAQKYVRLILSDSTIVQAGTDGLADKLQHNTAG
jgi:hypothetical protein